MRRRQLERPLEDRPRLRDVAERKVLLDCLRVDLTPERRVLEEPFELGGEGELAARQRRVVERLDPEPVAGEQQRFAIPVPKREVEHAAEALHAVLTPLFPRVDDHLGVAPRLERVPESLQFGDEVLEVVDLPVEDHHDAAVLVVERLLARREVDDREPAMPEADARLEVGAPLVRPAVMLALVHARDEIAGNLPPSAQIDDADDSTHGSAPHREALSGTLAAPGRWSNRSYSAA